MLNVKNEGRRPTIAKTVRISDYPMAKAKTIRLMFPI